MKIEVNYNELYNLGDYMEKMFEELKKDFDEINIISESLNLVLQGSAEQTISTRMKNFNTTQFSQIVNYTHLLGSEVTNCAKAYNAEDDEFAQKMKQEASKYGINDGVVASDSRYQTQSTSSGYVSATPTTSTTSAGNTPTNTSINENKGAESVRTETVTSSTTPNSQNDTFEDVVIKDAKSDVQNINFETQTGKPADSAQTNAYTNINSEPAPQTNNVSNAKSKGMFGGLFGAAAAAMGFKFASNKKDKKENSESNTVK